MAITSIRKKLADYMLVADDKKVKAVYALLEEDIELKDFVYTPELKRTLDNTYTYYEKGGKMVSAAEAEKKIKKVLQTSKRK
jgi:hypothetical protein